MATFFIIYSPSTF